MFDLLYMCSTSSLVMLNIVNKRIRKFRVCSMQWSLPRWQSRKHLFVQCNFSFRVYVTVSWLDFNFVQPRDLISLYHVFCSLIRQIFCSQCSDLTSCPVGIVRPTKWITLFRSLEDGLGARKIKSLDTYQNHLQTIICWYLPMGFSIAMVKNPLVLYFTVSLFLLLPSTHSLFPLLPNLFFPYFPLSLSGNSPPPPVAAVGHLVAAYVRHNHHCNPQPPLFLTHSSQSLTHLISLT